MNVHLLLATALLFGMPGAALAMAGQAKHDHAAHSAGPVAHTHTTVKSAGMAATFHFNAPAKAAFTCPMHPEVVSSKQGTCPKCKMKLEKQTHHISVQLVDAKKQPVKGALVRLTLKDAHGMTQGLNLKGNGYYEGAFHLMPGKQQITAFVKRPTDAKAHEFKLTYEVK